MQSKIALIWTKSFSEYSIIIWPMVFRPKNKSNHDIFFPWFDHFSCRLTTSAFFSIFSPKGVIQQLHEPNFHRFWPPTLLSGQKWTFRNKLNKHSVTRNCSDLSLFEIIQVISKILQILSLQPRISKVFLDH